MVEVLEYRRGTGWIEAAVRAWAGAHRGGTVAYATPLAAGTIADRAWKLARGVPIVRTSARDMGHACADLVDQINNATLAHFRAQALLDATLAGAGRPAARRRLGVVAPCLHHRDRTAGGRHAGRLGLPDPSRAAKPVRGHRPLDGPITALLTDSA